MSTRTELWATWTTHRDGRAFEALVLPELPHLLGFARRLGCNPPDAEDALQDALTRLAVTRTDMPVAVGLRAWLCREVHTRARSRLRSERRRLRRQAHAIPGSLPARGIDSIDNQDLVRKVLMLLPDNQREAVELRFLHDLEYREVAHVLRISEGACRQRVSQALAALRRGLGPGVGTLVAALPLPAVPMGSALIKTALTSSALAPSMTGWGIALASTTSKTATAAIALVVGIVGTLGVQAALGPTSSTNREPVHAPSPALLPADREQEIASLRRQLAEATVKLEKAALQQGGDSGTDAAVPAAERGVGDYRQPGNEWRMAILQLADQEKRAAAWSAVKSALRSEDPTEVCAALWAVNTTSHVLDLDRTGLSGEIVSHLSRGAPIEKLEAWQALVALDRVAVAKGRQPVIDSALQHQLRQDTLNSPPLVRASMLLTLITANRGSVEGPTAETAMALLADPEFCGEAILGLAAANRLSERVAGRLLELAGESPDLGSAAMRFVLVGLPSKNRSIVKYLLRKIEGGDSGALKALQRGVLPEDASYVGERLRQIYGSMQSPDVRSQLLRAIGRAGDLSSRAWLLGIAEDESADSGLRSAAHRAVRDLDRIER